MNSHSTLCFIILLVACLAGVSSDIYAPSLPAIAHDLNAPIDEVQWSMAVFMLGVSLSQLVYGPISEGIGRKFPLLVGLIIAFIGSVICFYAATISVLIWGRFIQGIGVGAGASLWRAIFRDSFTGETSTKYLAYLAILITFVVPAAPTLGGYLSVYFGWRSVFIFLVLYALITILIVCMGFRETGQYHHKNRLRLSFIFSSFQQLLSSRIFMGYALCTFLSYGAFFSWYAVGPVLLIKNIGISPVEFGWITLLGGGTAMAVAGYLNGKIVSHVGSHFMLRLGWLLMVIAGVLMLAFKFLYGINIFIIVAPMIVFYFGSTFIWPAAFTGAFAPFGKLAGYASALYSFLQLGGATVLGSLVAYLPDTDQMPLACIFIVAPALAWGIFESVVCLPRAQCYIPARNENL
ncbi:MAG: multidrug effflux MFS transporter [Pseudomonadota bacterium]